MKTSTAFILILISVNVFTQGKDYYSGTLTVGGFIPIGDLKNEVSPGYNTGLELEIRNTKYAVYLNSRINFSSHNNYNELFIYDDGYKKKTISIIEVNIGPRLYFGDKNELNGNIDLGFGLYTGNFKKDLLWGPQLGLGFCFPVSHDLQAVFNNRINFIGFEEGKLYWGIHVGLKYCFNSN